MLEELKTFLESNGWTTDQNDFTKTIMTYSSVLINGMRQTHPVTAKISYLGEGAIEDTITYGVNFGGDDEWLFENIDDIKKRYHEIFDKYS